MWKSSPRRSHYRSTRDVSDVERDNSHLRRDDSVGTCDGSNAFRSVTAMNADDSPLDGHRTRPLRDVSRLFDCNSAVEHHRSRCTRDESPCLPVRPWIKCDFHRCTSDNSQSYRDDTGSNGHRSALSPRVLHTTHPPPLPSLVETGRIVSHSMRCGCPQITARNGTT